MVSYKIGVIGKSGKWSTETLADAIEKRTGFRLIIDMSEVYLDLRTNKIFYNGHNLCDLDAMVIKKISSRYNPNTLDRLEILRIAEHSGVKVFSSPEKIIRLLDRLSCTITLRNHQIPMPDTLITEDTETAFNTVKEFGVAIFKPLFSTKARGMIQVDSQSGESEIHDQIKNFKINHQMMYIQKYMPLPGKDMGLVFLNGQYLGTYARINQTGSWNTTINSGGRYELYKPSEEIIALASKAQSLFNMDYTTVDIAETEQGPVVFEVSAFGGFRGALEGVGIDAASLYTDHVINTLEFN
ncbi:MAG: GAK system ATP-grasp enzyme [Gammaproteobacteria bacterium]|nr:GAK system ATP-grasp enzyme [Gammaproteobacteria bacterium]